VAEAVTAGAAGAADIEAAAGAVIVEEALIAAAEGVAIATLEVVRLREVQCAPEVGKALQLGIVWVAA
jgi:hypothetical protein